MNLLCKQVKIESIKFLEGKTLEEISDLILNNSLSFKGMRNQIIKRDYYELLKTQMQIGDIFVELEHRFGIGESIMRRILQEK